MSSGVMDGGRVSTPARARARRGSSSLRSDV
jgi:hypothetical protein